MRVSELSEILDLILTIDGDVEIEIATDESEDGWYEIYDVEVTTNHRGNLVAVINTD
jgi:hypothetical protein